MAEQLLQEVEREIQSPSEERKYLRLVGGKVIYISEAEAAKEEVLAGPRKKLTEEKILVNEWNDRVEWANQLKERISLVHQMMRDDDQRPSQYEPAYNALWNEYRKAIQSLRELDSEAVNRFRDKVVARLRELEARINDLCDNWDRDYFDYFERTLACYEKNYDLMVALDEDSPLSKAQEVARCTREHLASRGWCLWRCRALGDEVIVVVRDENVKGMPQGYAVYTEEELEKLFSGGVSDSTLRLVHAAKKVAGAVIISVSDEKEIQEDNP
jgi:DNA repair ATPase RecN